MIERFIKWYTHSKGRIRVSNFINRQISNIRNNRLSNYIKELFLDYPLVMYSDKGDFYIYNMTDGILEDGRPYSDISVTSLHNYAKDFRKVNPFSRKKLLKKANEALAGNEQPSVRYKSILTVNAKVDSGDTEFLP